MDTDDVLRRLGRLQPEKSAPESICLSNEVLEAYRGGALDDGAAAAAELHLSSCSRCVDALVCLDTPVRSMSQETLDRVLAATAPSRRRHAPVFPRWLLSSAAAAAALLLYFAIPRGQPAVGVPPYALQLAGEVMIYRGIPDTEAKAPPVYAPDSDIVLRASPLQGSPSGPPLAAGYLRQPDGSWTLFAPSPLLEYDRETGMVELRVRAGALLGTRFGTQRIRMVLLPPGVDPPTRLADDAATPEGAVTLEAVLDYRQFE